MFRPDWKRKGVVDRGGGELPSTPATAISLSPASLVSYTTPFIWGEKELNNFKTETHTQAKASISFDLDHYPGACFDYSDRFVLLTLNCLFVSLSSR